MEKERENGWVGTINGSWIRVLKTQQTKPITGFPNFDEKNGEDYESLSLPLYHYPPHPQIHSDPNFTHTQIHTLSLYISPFISYIYTQSIGFILLLSVIISFFLDLLYLTLLPLYYRHLARVSIFSFLWRSVVYQFLALFVSIMDEFNGPRFEGMRNTFRRKRTQPCRRPKPEPQALPENHDSISLSSTPPADDAGKVSSDENAVDANPKRKVFNLNLCVSIGSSTTRTEGDGRYNNGGLTDANDGGGNENKLKKVKLKVGGVTRTIQPKSSFATVGSSKNGGGSNVPRSWPKLILQDNSDEDVSPPVGKKIGLQGIPWKDFSRGGFSLGRENTSIGKNCGGKQGEKSDLARKSKRVLKKRALNGDFDEEEDDEIRYLEKLKTVKAASRVFDDDSSKKHRSLSRVSKEDPSPKRSGGDSVSADTDYEEEDVVSDHENEGNKGNKLRKESPDSPNETKRETALTSRQRALLSGRDSGSASTQVEFPNGLPSAAPRKQKEKLTEVEQQLKKAEAAERRRIQNEKAARESEAEAIRKILGQDSSRKKREDKLKKRQEELAQEKAANAKMLAPNTIRTVLGPTGTVVAFAQDIDLPHIFYPKPTCYPPSREKCVGPSCTNVYKYRDSKSNLPLCSLQCYKVIHERMQTAC